MHFEEIYLILVVVIPIVFVMFNRLRMDLAALSMAVLLGLGQAAGLGILGPAHTPENVQAVIAGFSQPVVLTLISLFILTRGMERSGVTHWIARQILRVSGTNQRRLIGLFTLATALLSLVMNNLAAGALVLPSAMMAARKAGLRPSKLLIPVAFGSLLGGSATYFTTANIIVSDLLRIAKPPQSGLQFLDFLPTGGLIALAGIAFIALVGPRLLPDREPTAANVFGRYTGSELEDYYGLGERLWSAHIQTGSALIGHSLTDTEIGKQWGVTVAALQRGPEHCELPDATMPLHAGDDLLLVGREELVMQLCDLGLEIVPARKEGHLSPLGVTFAEAILSPHSRFEGKTLKELNFRRQYALNVVAIKRLQRSYRTGVGDIPLQMGDSLLVIGLGRKLRALRNSADLIVVEPDYSDQPLQGRRAALVVGVTLAAIAASIAGAPVFLCVLVAALILLLTRVVLVEEAYRTIEWQAIFLIAGMYTVSVAMTQTGLAMRLGSALLGAAAPLGPIGIAGGAYLITAVLTQVMGGQVSAMVTGPVTISAALATGMDPHAVAVATAIGCSASFLTPMAHPVNILMIAPANYRFSDFTRIGVPLTVLCFVMLLVGLKLFWGL